MMISVGKCLPEKLSVIEVKHKKLSWDYKPLQLFATEPIFAIVLVLVVGVPLGRRYFNTDKAKHAIVESLSIHNMQHAWQLVTSFFKSIFVTLTLIMTVIA